MEDSTNRKASSSGSYQGISIESGRSGNDNIADIKSVCDRLSMKLLRTALIGILVTGCSAQDPEVILGSCWNVNDLMPSRVAGQGVFITSMEGMSLQAAGCSDQNGHNSFELKSSADLAIRKFLESHRGDRFVGFAFHGHIDSSEGGRLLVIEQVYELRAVQEPYWMTDLTRRRGLQK